MLCSYGCGEKGTFTLKNGKVCCSEIKTKCKALRLKNSLGQLYHKDRNIEHKENKKIIPCLFCKTPIANTGLKSHEDYCYLNPKNKKICPVCNKPIKKYNINKTCSKRCGALYHRIDIDSKTYDTRSDYRSICFYHHGKKCLLCNEELILEAHHIDGNRTNNTKENLIPLCPTHHQYIHHIIYYYIVKECIDDYLRKK